MMPQGSTFTTRPQLAGTFGMVASTHWLASAAGMAVLEKGGNAFDAAVAAGLVLQVVEPHLNGPGGEVPIIGYDAGQSEVFVLDGQGPAPLAATPEAFGALGLDLVPGSGLLPACVPAAFGTWMLLLAAHGRLRLREVMEYAIGYARGGYPVVPGISAGIASVAGAFREHWPSSAEIYLADGVPAPGARLANPVLAATYQRLLDEAEAAGPGREAQIEAARRAFYQGFVAEAIGAYLEHAEVMDVTGERHRALLAADDLAGWRAGAEPPVTGEYAGLTVCKTGPWGQGPVFLQQLALLAGFDLAAMGRADYIHTVVECAKLAFADREAWYGDPRAADVPLAALLSAGYAAQRRGLVGPAASPGRCSASRMGPGWPATGHRAPGSRSRGWPGRCPRGTRATSTPPTGSATWSPPPPAGAGCRARRWSPASGSASAPGRRCSPSPPGWRTRWRRASARAPPCRRPWWCAAVSPTSRSAPRAGTSRTSGAWPSSSTTCTTG